MDCQSHIVDVDKHAARTKEPQPDGCGRGIGMTSLSIISVSYKSLYGILTIAALAHDPTGFG